MNGDIERTSEKSEPQASLVSGSEGLHVEIRMQEIGQEAPVAHSSDVAFFSGQHWKMQALVLSAVLLIAGTYVGRHLDSGWVPADDGILAQSALRVFHGELPHRDFTESYTGGLSLIHALAFRAFGVNLMSLRICVFLFVLLWIPAVYYIALRFTTALGAGMVTLLAVSWSFPNYPAAMPS